MPAENERRQQPQEALSQELRVLLACCMPDPTLRAARLTELLAEPIDWERLKVLVKRHRVPGIAHRSLSSRNDVPAKLVAAFARASQANAIANLSTVAFLRDLAPLFREAGVEVIVLKGVPLSLQAYGDLVIRHSRDLDLLVRPADVQRTENILLEQGFERASTSAALTPRQVRLWMRARKHFEYRHPRTGMLVELHWRTEDNAAFEQGDAAFRRSHELPLIPGVTVRVLSQTDLLPALCSHGAGHLWFRLKWLADVAALFHAQTAERRKEVLEEARAQGLERPVLQAFLLCDRLLGVPAPEMPSTPVVDRLVAHAVRAIQQEIEPGSGAFVPKGLIWSRLQLHPGLMYKARELHSHLTSPADWQQFPLPDWLQFAYPLLRLPFWFKRRPSASRG